MAITYSDSKKKEFENFKNSGGEIVFEIDATDISCDRNFETEPTLQSCLKTGFEIPPTSLIHASELQALIQTHGSVWDYILVRIYLSGGKVVYKKKTNGKYEACCSIPRIA